MMQGIKKLFTAPSEDQIMQQVRLDNVSMDDVKERNVKRIPSTLRKYMDMPNVATDLEQSQLDVIGDIVFESTETDKNSRSNWETLMREAIELITPDWQEKNSPWKGSANIKFPLVMSACIQFNARTNPEIIKNDKVVEIRAMIPDKDDNSVSDRANRLSSHMSYQLLGQSANWTSDTDKLLMMLPMLGVVFRKSYFDPITGNPETVLCLPQDIIINNNVRTLATAQRVTHLIYMTRNEILENIKAGLFLDVDLDDLSKDINSLNTTLEPNQNTYAPEPVSYTTGSDAYNGELEDILYCFEEQHRYLDLDGDGYQEPYIVTIHKDTHKVMRICARYDESSFEFNSKGKMVKINATEFFTDYHFIPNPDGTFYSFGFGALLSPLNATVNTLLNQLIDAGTLSNRQSGFIGSGLRTLSGDFSFEPGEWKKIQSTPGEEISKNLIPLPIKEPSQVLFALLQFIIESAKMITAVSSAMEGEQPPPNQPATTTMAMIEQGQQVYSSILYRIYDALKREFKKQYNINRKYLNEEETFPMAEGVGIIRKEDYIQPDYGIFPVADPKLSSSMQRMMQAQALMQLMGNPLVNQAAILTNYLETLKISDPKKYMVDPATIQPTTQQKLDEAKIRNTNMDTAAKLMDRELKAIELSNEEAKQKSQAAYYGGQLATQKIEAIKTLVEINQEATPREVATAAREEESMTKGTQIQDMPQDVYQRLDALEKNIGQLLGGIEQSLVPQQPQQQMPMSPSAGMQVPMMPGNQQ